MGNRRQAREAALGFLYQKECGVSVATDAPQQFITHFQISEPFQPYFLTLVEGVLAHTQELDQEIETASLHWKLYRMSRIDRSILRLATWELLYEKETSHEVIINEAVELAKIYGSQDSSKFVNGVLDSIAKKFRVSEVTALDPSLHSG